MTRIILRSLACLLVALATSFTPALAAGPAPDLSVTGTLPFGRCLDATHQDMGPGQYVQAPDYLDPWNASDAELACYGLPPRPMTAEGLRRWRIFTHSLTIPRYWVHQQPVVLVNRSHPLAAPPAAPLLHRSQTWAIKGQTTIYGGWEPWTCSATNNTCPNNAWLVQGQWTVPSIYKYTNHLVSQWVGLGCCNDQNNQLLLQAGSYYYFTCPRGCYPVAGMFWEVPRYNSMQSVGPAQAVGDTAAAVVEENDVGQSLFETCNETTSQCTYSGPEPYADTGDATQVVEFNEEDTGVYGQSSPSDDPPYYTMQWGPVTGPNNQNIVDENGNPNSIPIQNLWEWSDGMNATGNTFVNYMDPATNIDSNTNFKICGTAPNTNYYPTNAPQSC